MKQNTIRPFLFGVLAVLLSYAGQRALRADALVDAALLYAVGVALFIVALRLPLFYPERALAIAVGPLPGARSRRLWLAGGLLLMAADVAARVVIAPQELPVGVLTAVLGGMYLLWLMHQRSR